MTRISIGMRLLTRTDVGRAPVDDHQREHDGEGRTPPGTVTEGRHRAAVELGQLSRDRQSQSEAAMLARE